MTTEQKTKIGKELIEVLGIKKNKYEGNFYDTCWGTKTPFGIYEVVKRIMNGNYWETTSETTKVRTLTLKQLEEMKSLTVFAKGETVDSPDGINMTNSGKPLRWIAVRGHISDWAIYCSWSDKSWEWIKSYGAKIASEISIKRLVPCEDDAFQMYCH
ncbi:MAG: hypothetical protein H8D22_10735 [Candidatus Cloacimonetes bacterium]|nr:hypothetical protein [Candidatus Cloacimonadota bacterium]